MAMSTLGIYHSELYRGGQKEDDTQSVNTTNTSVTIKRSNVSEFALENNARAQARDSVDGFLRQFGPQNVSDLLDYGTFLTTVRRSRGDAVAVLSDEDIIEQGWQFVQQHPHLVVPRSDASELSSLGSRSLGPADSVAPAADAEIAEDLMNQSIRTFPHSTGTDGTAMAAVQAAEHLQDSNSDSVHNLEPINIGNEDAPAVSPPRPVQQQQQQVRRPVQRDAAVIASNHENGGNRQLSAALAGGTGNDLADTSNDGGNGQDEENEDRKPNAKKPRLH